MQMRGSPAERSGKGRQSLLTIERLLKTKESSGKRLARISVRELVEFLLRSGDIDSRLPSGTDKEAMLAGGRIHRKIQKSQKANYQSEVLFRFEEEREELILRVEGRADGVITEEDGVTIDEIKGVYRDVTKMEGPVPVHLAQAKCYAFMQLHEEPELPGIGVQMTYADLDSEEIRRFSFHYERAELENWFAALMDGLYRWSLLLVRHMERRNASMEGLSFPFPYREGQKKLTAAVYRSIEKGEQLFLMAPTGVGKTMAAVYPSVRAVGTDLADRIFYLTAKNETRKVGVQAFRILMDRGLLFRVADLTSKEKICPQREVRCTPEDCPYARGHFDRINEVLYFMLEKELLLDRETVLRYAKEEQVCPFELELDLASFSDAVIGDYNYAFDPSASLRRFFGEGVSGRYVLLVDEAHNLPERARDMYSASLEKKEVLAARRLVKGQAKRLVRHLSKLNALLLAWKKEETGTALRTPVEAAPVIEAAQKAAEAMEAFFHDGADPKVKEELLDFYFHLRSFTATAERIDEHYLLYTEVPEDGEYALVLRCMNPAERLSEYVGKARTPVFFSATLLPVQYYKSLLTTKEDAAAVYARSPFDTKRRKLLIASDVETRYHSRGPELYGRIAEYIFRTAKARKGNYLAFFPSYRFLKDVFAAFRQRFGEEDVDWVVQSPQMREEDREIFLENFMPGPKRSLVGFVVMGGMFAEGIDLTGEKLIGAVVAGCGLPQVSESRELMKRYYDERGENGFDYAYRFPGINKVQQSAGRVIRTAEDRGVILLLDSRLLTAGYRRLFPLEWSDAEETEISSVWEQLTEFWSDSPQGL